MGPSPQGRHGELPLQVINYCDFLYFSIQLLKCIMYTGVEITDCI